MNNTSHTNIGRSRLSIPLKALSAFLAVVMFFWPVAPVMGRNLPSGWNVVKGQVTVTVNGKTMTVDQATAKAIVNWDSFDVGKGYTVDINQISTKAAMLARVVGANASEILGSLKATGGLYLVNPNGILFGSGAVIDVNRLIASTYDISNDDFWSGNLKFQGDSGASVVNRATINAESAALIGKNVENYGTINASQAALVGAAGPVKLDNFGNGANLSIDFSGLTGAHDTKVVNEGTINAAGGEAILTAEAGKGLVEANNGTVVASSAEFSGKNSAPSNLGNLTADRILLDPEGSIVIGSLQAVGYKGKDGTRYAEYHPNAGGAIPPTLDAPFSASSNAECATSNMTVYDKDGNGWTYTYSTQDVTDPLTGATRVQYNYGTPVCTYYNSEYLTGHLQTANWGFSYTSGGGWAGDVTFTRGEGENLKQIMIGGTFGLSLEAERNLGLLDYVHFNNPNDIKLQGGNLVIGNFASVEALGNVSIIANTALANTGRLDITTPKRVELFINGGEAAFGTLNITSFEDDIFLRTSNLNVAGKLMLNAKHDIYATGEDMKAGNINFTTNAGDVNVNAPVTTKWMVLAAGRDVQINGAANTQSNIHITAGRDAVSTGALDVAEGAMTITAGRDATLAKLSTAHPNDYSSDVRVTAKNTVTLNGEVTGGRLWATATEGDVVIKAPVTVDMRVGATAGRDVISTADLTATDGSIEIIAGRDATLARLAASPGVSSVNVNAGNDVTLNGTVDAWFVIIDAKNNATLNDDVTGGERVHASAAEGDLVVNGDVTANDTFVELLAGRDAEINGNINASNGLYGKATITAKNNATINGTIKAGGVAATATEGDLLITGDVTSTRNIYDDATTFTAGRDVKIDGSVTSAGRKNATIITAGRDIIATADIANADESITATAGRDASFAKLTAENGDLTVTAKNNAALNGAVSANAVAITATEGDLVVKGAVAANDGSGKFVAGQDVKIVKDGNVSAKGDLTVEAGRDITSESDIASTEGKVALDAKNAISVEGEVSAAGNVDLMATDGNVKVTKAITSTDESVTIQAGHDVDVKDVSAGRALAINAGQDVDTGALTAGNGTLLVAAARNITVGDISATSDDVPSVVLINSENGSVRTEGINVGGNAYVTGKGDVTTNGAVNADRSVVIGSFEGNVEVKGATGKDVTIKAVTGNVVADNVTANGADGTDPALRITAGRDIEAGSLEAADGTVSVEAKNNALIDGDVSANTVAITATEGDLVVTAPVTSTVEGVTLAAGQDAKIEGAVTAEKDATITAGRDIAATADVTSNNGNIAAAAGRDASFAKLIAENGEVTVTAKNSATLGAITTQNVNVSTTDGDITLTEDLTAKGINLAANSGNVTTEALTATETDINVNAGIDATLGDLEAKGMVLVTAKNNATLKGTATGLAVSVTATEGDLKAAGDVKSTGGELILTAGQDVSAAGLESELGNVKVTAGRDAAIAGETKAREAAEITVGRDATTGAITADEGAVKVAAKNNATIGGAVKGTTVNVAAAEGDLKAAADITSTVGNVTLTAGKDASAAGVTQGFGDVTITAGQDATANVVTAGGKAAITAGRDATTGAITATDGSATVAAKNNATVDGAIEGKGVTVTAAKGDAKTGNIDAKSGHATVTAGQDATIGDVTAGGKAEITAGRDATTGAITADDGAARVIAKNNATVNGAINGRVVRVEATEGDASLNGDATASAGHLNVMAGRDAKVAADVTLKSETGNVSVEAGRDALVEGALEAEELAEITAGRDATAGNLTAGRSARIIAKNNATANGDINAFGATIRGEEGDASVNANVMTTTGHLILDAGHNVKVAKNIHLDSAANVDVKAGKDAILDGDITAEGGTATITATNDVEAKGGVFAAEDVTINAGRHLAVGNGVTSETGAIKMDAAAGDMNINAPNGVTAAKEITLEAGIGNINIEGDSTIKGTDVTIHTATGNVTSGKNTTVEATTDNILVDASQRADMLGTLKAENGSVTVKAGLGATVGTVIAKDANIEANTGDIILEEDMTAGDINLDAKRGYVITKSLTATDDSITVNAGIDATLDGNLTAENGDVSVTAKNNAAITGTVTANEVTLTATEGDLTAGNDITANGRMATLAAGRDIAVAGGIKAPAGGVEVVAGRDASINGAIDAALSADVTAKNNATVDAVKGSHVTLTATDGTLAVNGDVTATDGDAGLTAGHDVEVAGGTTLSAAMDVNVKAGRDAAIEGAIAATVNARVNAGHDAKVGAITAEQGDAIVDAGSNIEMNGDVSANNIYAFAKDESLVSNGVLAANGEVILNAGTYMRLNNDVKGVRVGAVSIDNMFVDGNIEATGADIFLMSNRNAWINGTLKANTDVHVDAIDSLDVFNTVDAVTGSVMLNANNSLQAQGAVTAAGDVSMATDLGNLDVYGDVKAGEMASFGSNYGNVAVYGDVGADYIVASTNNGNASVSGDLTAEDSVTVQAGLDAKVDGDVVAKGDFIRVTGGRDVSTSNLTAENGNIKVIAGNNADLSNAAKAKEISVEATAGTIASVGTLEATDGDITLDAGKDVNYLHANASGNITADAGRDIRAYGPTTAGGDVKLTARGNLMSNGNGVIDAEGDAKLVTKDGDVILKATVNAKNVTIEAGRDASTAAALTAETGDVTVTAGRDAALAALTANTGDVTVTAKDNASLNGAVNATTVRVKATEGDLKVNAPVMSTEDLVVLNAGRDVKTTAAVTAEGDMLITAGRDISADDELKSNKHSVIAVAGRDARLSRTTAEGDVIVEANSNVKLNGDVDASNIYVTAKEESLESNGVLTADGAIEFFAGTHAYINNDVTGGNVRAITINNMFVDGNIEATDADIFLMSNRNAWIHGTLRANTDVYVSADESLDVFNTVDAVTGSVMLNANNSLQAQGAVTAAGDVSMATDLGNLDVYGDVKAGEMASFGSNYGNVAVYGDVGADYIVASTNNGNASVSGDLTAEDSVTVQAGLDAKVDGDVVAKGDFIRVTGGRDVSTSNLTAENGNIKVIAGNNADLSNAAKAKEISVEATAGTIASVGTLEATDGDITLDAGKDVNYLHANASGNITADAGRDIRAYGPTTAGGDVKLTARGNLMSNDNGVIDAEGDAKLVAKDGDVTLKGTVNAKNVAIEAGHDVTTLAEVTAEAGDVTVDAGRDAALAELTANAGDVTVTAKGNASLNGAVNATTVTATATEGDVKVNAPVTATEDDVILTARRDVVVNGKIVAEEDALLTATDGSIAIEETVTANTGNVQANAGKEINVDAAVEATAGDVNFTAVSDVNVYAPVKAGKTVDIISMKGDVYTSKYGDLTAENGFIMVSALLGDVELAGDATAENGDVIIYAGKDIDIHAPSNILAQNVNMKTAHGDVSNDGSIAAKGLEDSMVMVNANGNILNTGSIQADKAVKLISTKDIRNTGSIQAGTATEKPLTPGSMIEFNADGKATSTGSLVAETITGLAADDITITGELNTDYLNLKTTGSDGDITVETGHDIIAASLVTEGDQADISFNGKNVDEMTAETKGTDADIDIKGGKMTIRKAVTFDGDVDIAGSGDLVLDVVEAKDGGKYTGPDRGEARHVNVTSGGMVKILTHVKADADVNIDARGPILDTDYAVITSGGDTSLTTGAYIGDVADGNPIHVEAEGTIYVNPRPGTPKVEYFAFVEGTSGDGQIHTKASSLPGLVIFNSVPWMGTKKQMGRLDRSYAEKFSAINGMLEVFNLSYPLVAEYRYFPHTILDLDGFTNAPRKGIEIIRMGGEKGGTINGLPEGLTPRNIPSVSDYEWTFLWPLDNEDADNAAEPVEATVSER